MQGSFMAASFPSFSSLPFIISQFCPFEKGFCEKRGKYLGDAVGGTS
jgi:hypothetical protein